MTMLNAVEAEQCPLVTTLHEDGGVGVGRLVDGAVYFACGPEFYQGARDVIGYIEDDGHGYQVVMMALRTSEDATAAAEVERLRSEMTSAPVV